VMRLTSYGAATKLASIPSVFRAGDRVVENSILQFLAQPRCAIRAHRPLGALATILYWRSSTGGWHRPRSGIIAKPSPRKGVAIQRRPSNRSSLNRDPILPFRAGLRPLTDQKGPKTRHRRGRPSAAASRDLARPSPRKAFDTRPVVAVGLAFLAGSNFMDILGTPLADIPAFTRSAAKSRSKSREPDNCSTHFGRSGEAASWADEAQIAAACGLPVLIGACLNSHWSGGLKSDSLLGMSKEFRSWKIDEAQLLPPSVQDYVPKDHLSRLIVALVREELDLSAIGSSYRSVLGQPPFDPRLMTALLLHGYASGVYSSRRIAKAAVERADFMMIVAGDLTRQMDDDAAYKRAERAAPPFGGDVWFNRLSDEREPIEALIAANAEPTIEAIAVKLRMMAWHMRYEEGGLTGERSPTQNEKTITSALAAAERLALARHQGEG
jgi:hypothetical protein